MANSEIKAALRTFYREKSYAIINLSGLALAIACCLILGLYLRSELTYDRHHLRYKQIFRVVNEFTTSGSSDKLAYTSVPLGRLLKENYPEVKDYVRLAPTLQKVLIRSGDRSFYWDDIYSTDENVFDIFTHKILYGDPKAALKDISSAAVSESFARKYFNDSNPIGKTINIETTPTLEAIPRKITLVFRDLPENTHVKYSALFRMRDLPANIDARNLLFGVSLFTYLLMPENYNVDDFKAVSSSFYTRYMEGLGQALKMNWQAWLQPLADIHLHSDISYDLPTGNIYYVYGFAAVAVFILLVACINYVNLATARGARRAKEIGMRKILGAPRLCLMSRFLGQSVIFSLVAVAFSVILVEAVLKLTPINALLGKPLALGLRGEPALLLWMLGLGLVVGFVSGLYPALYLSSIAPMTALASTQGGTKGRLRIREFLVLTQFTISVVVIACTLLMALQMRYVSNKSLGFAKEDRVIITMRGADVIEKFPVIKNELLKDSRVLGVSAASAVIGTGQAIPLNAAGVDNKDGVAETTALSHIQVGEDFLQVMGIPLASGRDFSRKLLTDIGTTFVVNETMVRNRGWKEPLGRHISLGTYSGKVIGVVKDFHFKSLHTPVEPLAMYPFRDNFDAAPSAARAALQRILVVHIKRDETQGALRFLQDKFAVFDPKHPFEFEFLDDSINKLYMPEERLMKMTGIFSGICILISCMGLYGLAAFATEQRTKEIGIRKVLGATASQIVFMLARKTLWLVLAGSIVASVIAWYAMDEWLSGFAYRAGIHPMAFVVSAAVVIAVAFATIALQSYKAARSNPAVTLRYE